MTKYSVRLIETAAYILVVEADSPEEAERVAKVDFLQAENINSFFSHVVEAPYADAVIDETGSVVA